jgi:hypothetical protein
VKRVLFDESMPHNLRRDLTEFAISTAQAEGLSGVKNGELLRRASQAFEVLLTIDHRMRYQQNVAQFRIGIVVIEVPDTRIVFLRSLLPRISASP